MASPFPGMDPYLESHWRDIHARLVIYACDALQGVLPSALRARVDQCYRNGAYDGTLNHAAEPDPPMFGADKEWADSWLREKGLRPGKKSTRRGNKTKRS